MDILKVQKEYNSRVITKLEANLISFCFILALMDCLQDTIPVIF